MTDTKRNVGSGEDRPGPDTGGATRLIEKIAEMLDPEPDEAKDRNRPPPVPPV